MGRERNERAFAEHLRSLRQRTEEESSERAAALGIGGQGETEPAAGSAAPKAATIARAETAVQVRSPDGHLRDCAPTYGKPWWCAACGRGTVQPHIGAECQAVNDHQPGCGAIVVAIARTDAGRTP